jgi:formylglycine-generating enzyme required for sulfatase activity
MGMQFVPLPGAEARFSIWETRVSDCQAFVEDTKRNWKKPSFEQGPDHPAVSVSLENARASCFWLTIRERKAGTLTDDLVYRLRTDAEWSLVTGLITDRTISALRSGPSFAAMAA